MPLYEYVCDNGHRFELIRKFSDSPLDKCPTCGAPVHKLQSAPAIQFKGSGFYITDYAKKEHVAAAKADHDSPSKSSTKSSGEGGDKSGSSDTKSETKTETKSETKSETKTETKPAATPAKTSST
jgi:putative FmdB family regulatory protein